MGTAPWQARSGRSASPSGAQSHCPVVVFRGEVTTEAPDVVGIDDSSSAPTLLAFALEQATARGVPPQVIRAWLPVSGIWEKGLTVTEQERQPFDDLLTTWRDKHPEAEIAADAVVGHPAGILIEASTQAQLLVVGTRGRRAVRGMLLGSVSQHLLRHSACTAAVVHEAAPA